MLNISSCDKSYASIISNTLLWWVQNHKHTEYEKLYKYISTYSTNP